MTRDEIIARAKENARRAKEAPATSHVRTQDVPPHVADAQIRAFAAHKAYTCAVIMRDGTVGAYLRECYKASITPDPAAIDPSSKPKVTLTQYGYGIHNADDAANPALTDDAKKRAVVGDGFKRHLLADLAVAFGWDESDLDLCQVLFEFPRTKAELKALYFRLAEGESLDYLADNMDHTGYMGYSPVQAATKSPDYTPEPSAEKALAEAKAKRSRAKK